MHQTVPVTFVMQWLQEFGHQKTSDMIKISAVFSVGGKPAPSVGKSTIYFPLSYTHCLTFLYMDRILVSITTLMLFYRLGYGYSSWYAPDASSLGHHWLFVCVVLGL